MSHKKMMGESTVLIGEQPATLLGKNITEGSLQLRSKYKEEDENCVIYKEGVDYIVDYIDGTISRTKDSSIPDFANNILYDKVEFDHTEYASYGNHDFFVYADYEAVYDFEGDINSSRKARFVETEDIIRKRQPLKILIYGDSISTGLEASCFERTYYGRLKNYLNSNFDNIQVNIENRSVGGHTTREGLKVLNGDDTKGDIAILAFGMNDASCNENNPYTNNVPLREYRSNIEEMINILRKRQIRDILLVSPCWPNQLWKWSMNNSSSNVGRYAEVLDELADIHDCEFANITQIWSNVLKRKKSEDLLGNNINHPNDFGHWIYFLTIKSIFF